MNINNHTNNIHLTNMNTCQPTMPYIYNTSNFTSGYLQLIIGPMFSGKTSTILELKKQYDLCNIDSCVINYAEDKRYDDSLLSTHDQQKITCTNLISLTPLLDTDILQKYTVFFINEGQFFPDLFQVVKLLVEKYSKIVYVCGLDSDFKRNSFDEMIKLYPIADNIIKKYSLCVNCKNGTKALFSYRKSNEKEIKVIGSDNYIPLCRKCYLQKSNM